MKEKFEIPPVSVEPDPMATTENEIEKGDIRTTKRVESHEKPKKGNVVKKALKKIGMVGALLASLTSGASAQKKTVDDPFGEESLPKVSREYKPTKTVGGDRYTGLTKIDDSFAGNLGEAGQDVSVVVQHNIEKPKSLSDIGKMLLEPISVSLSFPYGEDNVVAKVRTMLGYKEGKPQIAEIEIPYRYAEKFDKADPKNREEMKKQAMADAEKLLEKILTNVFGLSFFKVEAEEHHREFSTPITKVESMRVGGFASPESSEGINLGDIRNQKLSKLRAENATETIRELFRDKNIGVDKISFQGKGEDALSQEELKKLANKAVSLDLANPEDSQSKKVLEIIRDYNDGKVTEESALKLLEETVGSKRKVAIHLELNEEKKILVLPIPLLLGIGAVIGKLSFRPGLERFEDWRLVRSKSQKVLPHSFIRSKDPDKPTEDPPELIDQIGTRRSREDLAREAGAFFRPYGDMDSFFIVSSDDNNDIETANAYRRVAQEKGLEVIRPENTRGDSDNITGGFVRVIDSLSVDEEKSQEDVYAREFKNLIRLLNFGQKKIDKSKEENPAQKTIHILAFGHGDLVQHAMSKYFKKYKHPIRGLEVIKLAGTKNPHKATASFRTQTKKIK